jgi:tetratricopeptide (TPR) repeat protein
MPDDKAMIVKMAFLYVQNGEWYKAIEEYKKLLQIDPQDPHVHNMVGDAYAKKKDDREAFLAYQKSREIYAKQGNMGKVTAIDKKVSKLSPEFSDIQQKHLFQSITKSHEADSLAFEGKFEEAVAYFLQLIAAEPINFAYREKLVSLYLEHAHVTEALGQLKAIADHHLSEGRPDQAVEYAEKMANIDPEGIDTIRLKAVLAKAKGNTEGVAQYYGKVAQLAFDAGYNEEAKAALEEAIQAGRADLLPLLAKVLMALKKNQEAKQVLETLLKDNPVDEVILEQLLTVSEDLKDWAAANAHITLLLQKRPDDPKLQPRLARVLMQIGKRTEALQIYMNLGLKAMAENKADAAFTYFDSILALEPDNAEALKKKAELYLKLGKKQELIDTYRKLEKTYTQKKMPEDAKKVSLVIARLTALK